MMKYPASAIEKQPQFHFLFPHIAIITDIAWHQAIIVIDFVQAVTSRAGIEAHA